MKMLFFNRFKKIKCKKSCALLHKPFHCIAFLPSHIFDMLAGNIIYFSYFKFGIFCLSYLCHLSKWKNNLTLFESKKYVEIFRK